MDKGGLQRKKYKNELKIEMLGDSGVGKTSIIQRFVENTFRNDTAATIGLDVQLTNIKIEDEMYTIALWDTAGQERYRTLASVYYRGANGFVLVYDVTRKETFTHLQYWIDEIQLYCAIDTYYIILVGNQIDKERERQVTYTMGETFARENHMLFIETSAKSAEGIAQTFTELVTKIIELKRQRNETATSDTSNNKISLTDSPNLISSAQRLCCQT